MRETLSKKETPVIIGVGLIIGIIAVALVYFGNPAKILCQCDYFMVIKVEIQGGTVNFFADASSFHHILVIDGEGNIECDDEKIEVKKGSSIFIPAGNGVYKISGKLDIICTKV